MLTILLNCCIALQLGSVADLGFSKGTLDGWEGEGFQAQPSSEKSPLGEGIVSSRDNDSVGHKAFLHRAITIPIGAAVIRFTAYAAYGRSYSPSDRLDVVLMAAGKRIIPKRVQTSSDWQLAPVLLPALDGRPREYIWLVDGLVGHPVRIVLSDEDDRPDCYVVCSGFQVLSLSEFEEDEFNRFMAGIVAGHKLAPVTRYTSRHFLALSNAEDGFSKLRLDDCELLYALFYDHFRRKGFPCREPASRLMVAIFDNQAGLESYLGHKMSSLVTGIYHPISNRLVVYDYGQNEALLSQKQRAERDARNIGSQWERQRYLDMVHRKAQEFRQGASVGTIMHEVAHQLSYNCGMLNRQGDTPLWLAEGLACYCEPTANGSWQGIGELNPDRLQALAEALSNRAGAPAAPGTAEPGGAPPSSGGKGLIHLRKLLENDDWFRGTREQKALILGYAQSWALFRMLMEEQPQALREYLSLIYSRKTPEHRLEDFQEAFGSDLVRQEKRYRQYVAKLVQQHVQPKSGTSRR
ncbi:MAG TPA: DUF1570 domain-containing protein [Gemmataceae bacterium]|nr:DUF1570 domain-containing protein [Gemmataceae bacterium]